MPNLDGARAGLLGWLAFAILVALALAGAASSPRGLVIGLPSVLEVAAALAFTGALAAVAGLRAGSLALGAVPLLAVFASGLDVPGVAALTGRPLLAIALAVAVVALARARPPWARGAFVPVLLVLHLLAAYRVQRQVGPSGDEPHYLMVTASLLEDGDLALQDDYAAGRYRAFHPADLAPHYRVRGLGGVIYSLHAVGLSVLVLPAYAVGGYAAVSFFMALLGVATAWQVRALVRDTIADDAIADAAGWIVGLSPPLLHFAGLVFTEVPAALGLSIALRLALSAAPSASRAWGAGIVLAALPWLNVRYGILVASVLAAALLRRLPLRVALGWIVPTIATGLALAAYHQALYGFPDPRHVYGRRPEFAVANVAVGLPGLFFDQEFGLWVYAPVFALAVPGLAWLARAQPRAALTAGGMVVAVVAVASAWPMWRGGFNPPARFLLPVLPVLALGAACWLKRGLTFPAALLVGWGLWTGLAGAWDRPLVHRDRDVVAPLFREHSGALEWSRLLPGFVLDESARDRMPLTIVWMVALAAAAAARKPANGPRVLLGVTGMVVAAAAAASLGQSRSGGRDAVRVVDRTAFLPPAGPVVREGAWSAADLGWGPLYEPHRHPGGAEVGSRLPLPAGAYVVEIDADRVPSTLPAPILELRAPRATSSVSLIEDLPGTFRGGFDHPAGGEATLALRGGGPLILKEIRVRTSTFWPLPGPIR